MAASSADMLSTLNNPLTGISSPQVNLGSTSTGSTPTKQYALDNTSSTPAPSSLSSTSTPSAASGTAATSGSSSSGGVLGDLGSIFSDLFGGGSGGGSTLGIDLAMAMYALNQAKQQQSDNQAQANTLKDAGQPYIDAGNKSLGNYQSGTINPAQQGVADQATQAGNQLLNLPQNALLSDIASKYLGSVDNQTLLPGDQAKLDQSTQAAKQQLIQQFANSGMTDSSVLTQQMAQIDQNALIQKQNMINSYYSTGDNAYNQFVTTTQQGQQLLLYAKQYVAQSVEQQLQDALQLTTEGLGPLEQGIQLQIQSDTQLAQSVGQLMAGLAQAYSMSLWKSGTSGGTGAGSGGVGGLLNDTGSLWNDIKGLFGGSSGNSTSNSGVGSGTINTGLPGSTTTGTTSDGVNYSGTQTTTTAASQISNPSSGGSSSSSLLGDTGTAVGGYQAADNLGLLGSGTDLAAGTADAANTLSGINSGLGDALSQFNSANAIEGPLSAGGAGGGGGAAAGGAGGAGGSAGMSGASAALLAGAGYTAANIVGDITNTAPGAQVNLNNVAPGVSTTLNIPGVDANFVSSDTAGVAFALGNDPKKGAGYWYYKNPSSPTGWSIDQSGTLASAAQLAPQVLPAIMGQPDASGNWTFQGSILGDKSTPGGGMGYNFGGQQVVSANSSNTVTKIAPDGTITQTSQYGPYQNTITSTELASAYKNYGGKASGLSLAEWVQQLSNVNQSKSGNVGGVNLDYTKGQGG